MSIAITDILSAVASHASASGHFERVNQHEVANAPGHGITVEIWVQRIGPVRSSGLASTSALLLLNVRLRMPATVPDDYIDPAMTIAASDLIGAYSGDFELGGLARDVDLLGENGTPLRAVAGWLEQDGTTFRVYTLDLPVVVNDLWAQSP